MREKNSTYPESVKTYFNKKCQRAQLMTGISANNAKIADAGNIKDKKNQKSENACFNQYFKNGRVGELPFLKASVLDTV
jgi:hypothetical protein